LGIDALIVSDLALGGPQFVFLEEVAAESMVQFPIRNTPLWQLSILIARAARHSKVVRGFVERSRQEIQANFDPKIVSYVPMAGMWVRIS